MKPRPPYLQTPDIVPGSLYLQIGLILGLFVGGLVGFATGLLLGSLIQ